MTRMISTFLLFVLFLTKIPTAVTNNKVTCTITPAESNKETNLTCYFPEDISQTKKDFTVYHDRDGSPDIDTNSVLDCFWISGKIKCVVQFGYEFINEVSDHIIVRIPQVSEKHTGRYSCQLYGHRHQDVQSCELQLQRDNKVTCKVHPVRIREETTLICSFPEDVSHTKKNIVVYHYTSDIKYSVLNCSWIIGKMECAVQPGFEFNNTVTDHITVRIPQALEKHRGTYSCQLTDSRPQDIHTCYFQLLKENEVRCEVPSVTLKAETTLTCNFTEDVSSAKKSISVYHFNNRKNENTDTIQNTVLNCTWTLDKIDCSVQPGYEFDGIITDHLTLRIPQASESHTGMYTCNMEGIRDQNIHNCYFHLLQEHSEKVTQTTSRAVGVFVGLIVAAISIAACFYYYCSIKTFCAKIVQCPSKVSLKSD